MKVPTLQTSSQLDPTLIIPDNLKMAQELEDKRVLDKTLLDNVKSYLKRVSLQLGVH